MAGYSSLAPAAIYVTCILGPLHLISTIGVIFGRHAPVFAARVPKLSCGALLAKTIGFFLISWLYLDPNCPCIVTIIMWWLDWIANSWHVLQKVILLWRCEIQAALDKSKALPSIAVLDEKNIFVRYRSVLRPRTQTILMLSIFIYCASYNIILLSVFRDLALQPCMTDRIGDNNLVLSEIVLCWITFIPVITFSTWSMKKLQKFPEDNWKIYWEARVLTPFTMIAALACLVVLIVIPTVDGIIFVHFVGPVWGSFFHYVLPLQLHRKTLSQLSKMDMTSLTSFERLLKNENFLQAFGSFLKKEFSSENLYFWLEVQRMQHEYGGLLPPDKRPPQYEDVPEDKDKFVAWMKEAAADCQHLGVQCVGGNAPWQINISGFTAQDMEKAMKRIHEVMASDTYEGLQEALEETLKTLVVVQHEVFELLRKDPFPRFLLTPAADKLNADGNFKRLLASEKLEDEAQKHTTTSSSKRTPTVDEGSSGKGSRNSEHKKEKKSSKTSKDKQSKKRSSQLFAYGEKDHSSETGSMVAGGSTSEVGGGVDTSEHAIDITNHSSPYTSPFGKPKNRSSLQVPSPAASSSRKSEPKVEPATPPSTTTTPTSTTTPPQQSVEKRQSHSEQPQQQEQARVEMVKTEETSSHSKPEASQSASTAEEEVQPVQVEPQQSPQADESRSVAVEVVVEEPKGEERAE